MVTMSQSGLSKRRLLADDDVNRDETRLSSPEGSLSKRARLIRAPSRPRSPWSPIRESDDSIKSHSPNPSVSPLESSQLGSSAAERYPQDQGHDMEGSLSPVSDHEWGDDLTMSDLVFGSRSTSQEQVDGPDRAEGATSTTDAVIAEPNPGDLCFGLVSIPQPKLHPGDLDDRVIQNLSLEPTGRTYAVCEHKTGSYYGLLDSTAAVAVREIISCPVRVMVSMTLKHKTLDLTVFGSMDDSAAVGDRLSAQGLYLQQPQTLDESTEYFNPQYLVRPGSNFREILSEASLVLERTQKLTPSAKADVRSLFDSATGPTTFTEVRVSNALKTDLKPHQRKALAMMAEKEKGELQEAEFPPLWVETGSGTLSGRKIYGDTVTGTCYRSSPSLCLGGLLADDMGLGKSLTILALTLGSADGSLDLPGGLQSPTTQGKIRGTLIVTPLSIMSDWEEQIRRHLKPGVLSYVIYHGPNRAKFKSKLSNYDVVLTTYDTLKADSRNSETAAPLQEIQWHRVVLDEAHTIRNRSSKVYEAVTRLEARHRWCLTGTPIQNHVEDFGALVGFLRVDPFDNVTRFRTVFVDPINKRDSEGYEHLRNIIRAVSLRRTKDAVLDGLDLPPREDRIHLVQLDEDEKRVYDLVRQSSALMIQPDGSIRNALQIILRLRQISNHGRALLSPELLRRIDEGHSGSLLLLDTLTCEACEQPVSSCDTPSKSSLLCLHQICSRCLLKATSDVDSQDDQCPLCSGDAALLKPARDVQELGEPAYYRPSSKVKALLHNLEINRAEAQRLNKPIPKSIIYSCWAKMLDHVEKALDSNAYQFARIDGAKSDRQRRAALKRFRTLPSCTILLATLGSAGVGLDLSVASRVHLLEPQWNPMVERQALDRVYRMGQTNKVLCTSYVVDGEDSIEQYMRRVQKLKLGLIATSFDADNSDQNQEIAVSLADLRATLRL